jgi:tRNA A-37 threonylcarbamoyl transferase component Bud32
VLELRKNGIRWTLTEDFAPLLDRVLQAPAQVIKESPAKLVTRHATDARAYYVKRYRHGAFLFRPLKFLIKPSQAAQEWRLAAEIDRRQVPIVRHVALGERWSPRGLVESALITEAFDGGVPLDQSHQRYFERVLEFVDAMARAGAVHGDFHPSNLLLNTQNGELRLVDLHGVKVSDGRPHDELRDSMLAQLAITVPLPADKAVLVASHQLRRRAFETRSKRCLKINRDFTREEIGGLRWQIRRAGITPEVENVLRDPDGFFARAKLLKEGRSSTVGAMNGLVLKRYNFKKPFNLVKDLFRGSRGARGFRKAYHLELCGYPTAHVIATADRRVFGFPTSSYILMREIEGAVDAGRCERDIAKVLGFVIARLHNEGFTHRDLKETNILIDPNGRAHLIDLDGLEFVEDVELTEAAANLRRLAEGMETCGKLRRRNAITFLRAYCRTRGISPRTIFPRGNRTLSHARRSP